MAHRRTPQRRLPSRLQRSATHPIDRFLNAVPVGFSSSVRIVVDDLRTFAQRNAQVLEHVVRAAGGHPINVLALSGRGAGPAARCPRSREAVSN